MIEDIVKSPVMVEKLKIVYPENARRTNIEGKVTVSALIDEKGKVLRVDVDKSDHPWLDDAAVEAMRNVKFTPAITKSGPTKVWFSQTITFKLNGDVTPAVLIGKAPELDNIKAFGDRAGIDVALKLDHQGNVTSFSTVDSTLQGHLTARMISTIRNMTFEPAKSDGGPVSSTLVYSLPLKIR